MLHFGSHFVHLAFCTNVKFCECSFLSTTFRAPCNCNFNQWFFGICGHFFSHIETQSTAIFTWNEDKKNTKLTVVGNQFIIWMATRHVTEKKMAKLDKLHHISPVAFDVLVALFTCCAYSCTDAMKCVRQSKQIRRKHLPSKITTSKTKRFRNASMRIKTKPAALL